MANSKVYVVYDGRYEYIDSIWSTRLDAETEANRLNIQDGHQKHYAEKWEIN